MTPLLDAAGRMINDLGSSLGGLPENLRPGKVIVIIITDGQENSSREMNAAQIKSMITLQENTYDWQFVFLGANFDAVGEGEKLGMKANASITYAANECGINNLSCSLTRNVSAYRTGQKSVVTFDAADYDAQRDAGA
jgi:hypothetical protein